jgi:hypothetical protein
MSSVGEGECVQSVHGQKVVKGDAMREEEARLCAFVSSAVERSRAQPEQTVSERGGVRRAFARALQRRPEERSTAQ